LIGRLLWDWPKSVGRVLHQPAESRSALKSRVDPCLAYPRWCVAASFASVEK
jgi:hypothetical protein